LLLHSNNASYNESEISSTLEVPEEDINITKPDVTEIPKDESLNSQEVKDVSTTEISETPVITETRPEEEVQVHEPKLDSSLDIQETLELNPVLEQTIELPQANNDQSIVETTEPTIIGMDELLKDNSVINIETPLSPEVNSPVENVESPTSSNINNESPSVIEPSVESIQQVQTSQPIVESDQISVQPQPDVVEQPITTPIVEASTVNPITEPSKVSADNNIEILNEAILDGAVAHANGSQRVVEVNSNNFSNQINNQKTLINKVA